MRHVLIAVALSGAALAVTGCATLTQDASFSRAPAAPSAAPTGAEVAIGVDTRAELFMTIFRLAGAREFAGGNPRYMRAVDAHFKPFADHPAVIMAKELRQQRGISYNAVPELAVSVGPLPGFAETVPLERQANLDRRWTLESARAFLAAARDFAEVSNAAHFYHTQRPLFTLLDRRARNLVANEADLEWVRRFYGDSGQDRFVIVPSMLAFQGNYGPLVVRPDGRRDLYAVIGIFQFDEDENPALGMSQAFTLVHEFGHSFVNPLILQHEAELAPISAALRAQSREAMQNIGYVRDVVVLYETIIRAGVARYKLAHSGAEIAERELERQRKLGFVWIDEFYQLLGQYEADRARYPTLAAFYPRMKAQIDTLPERLPAMSAAYDAKRPKIVGIIPALDGKPIDPSTRQIRIQFDRPMAENHYGTNAESKLLPKISRIGFEEGNRVMIIDVEREPNRNYEIPFFAAGDHAPRAQDGMFLAPTTLRFSTGGR